MDKKEIFKKYFKKYKKIRIVPGGSIYINISILKEVIVDLYSHGFVVSGFEFIKITRNSYQPFMDYSLWKKGGYLLDDLLNDIDGILGKVDKAGFDKNEIYFDISF